MKSKILLVVFFINLSFSKELSLSQAYQIALENNIELKSNFYQNLASQKRSDKVFLEFFPKIDVQAIYSIEQYKKDKLNKNIDESSLKYGLKLSQPIFNTSLYYNHKQEQLRAEISQIIYNKNKQDLAKDVAQKYLNHLYAKEFLQLSNAYLESANVYLKKAEKSLELGLISKIDLLETKLKQDEAKLELSKAKRQLNLSKLELDRILGKSVDINNSFLNINLDFFRNINLNKFKNLKSNADYQKSVFNMKIANIEKEKIDALHMPTIDFNLGIYKQYNKKYELNNKKQVEAQIRFSLPLFYSGAIKTASQEAEYLMISTNLARENKEKEIYILLQKNLDELLNLIDNYEISINAEAHAKTYCDFTQKAFGSRIKSLSDLLDANTKLFKSQIELLSVGHKLILSYLELENLIGGISLQTLQEIEHILQ